MTCFYLHFGNEKFHIAFVLESEALAVLIAFTFKFPFQGKFTFIITVALFMFVRSVAVYYMVI